MIGFVDDLRRELLQLRERNHQTTHLGGFYMSDDVLLRLASQPSSPDNSLVEHVNVRDVSRIPWSPSAALKFGVISFCVGDQWCDPYAYSSFSRDHISVLIADLEWGMPKKVRGLSYVLNPDMSLNRYSGFPMRYQPGTCDLLPIAAKMSSCDDIVMDFRRRDFTHVSFTDAVNHHRTSQADVTWVLAKGPLPEATLPVWSDGRVVVRDPRDLPEDMDPQQTGYHSIGLCVVSRAFVARLVCSTLGTTMWRRRQVIEDGEVTIRFERHLHELTAIDGVRVNYVSVP